MAERTALVTGASTGIGKEIARGLLREGFRVVVACRDEGRGRAALADLGGGDRAELQLVDLASQASIRDFARRLLDRHEALHVLVNNAGIWPQTREVGPDGIELTWATNVMGYHLLTALLLDRLKASGPARVVNVASTFAGRLDLDDVGFERRRFRGADAYMQSKQADRLLTWDLAERLAGTGVTANAVHPGMVRSELGRAQTGPKAAVLRAAFRLFGKTTTQGADTAIWLASSPEIQGATGKFWTSRREIRCRFRDAGQQQRLRALCDAMVR
jgi:NAD(P)-dependent dehydrogenase (short-subunit alcohol dehydrogenase family)